MELEISETDSDLLRPWWYNFFMKCRQEEEVASWEPPYWQLVCPRPMCPTYRVFARFLALFLIIFMFWGALYCVLGKTAAPGGQLFQVTLVCVVAQLAGWLMSFINMPELIGMLWAGIIFQNVGLVDLDEHYVDAVSKLRKVAFVTILIRAGLSLDYVAFQRLWIIISNLGLVPWIAEAVVIVAMTHYLLDLPWIWGCLLGSLIAAISPAVIVPCLLRLGKKGYGVAKGIPTLIIAVSVIDDTISDALFGILHTLMFHKGSLALQIIRPPLSVFGGIAFGIIWGLLLKYVPEKTDVYVAPLRTIILFGVGLVAIMGSDEIGTGGAGVFAVLISSFLASYFWTKQGWSVKFNPVIETFEVFWKFFAPMLFGLTGAQIKIRELDPNSLSISIGCVLAAVVIRIFTTILVAAGTHLNFKEKIFVSFSWIPKATLQAALGPAALDSIREQKNPKQEEKEYAEIVMTICILSIIITAPIGAVLITLSGPRLLTRTARMSMKVTDSPEPSIESEIISEEEWEEAEEEVEEKKEEEFTLPAAF